MPVVHWAPLEVSPVRENLFAGLSDRKIKGLIPPANRDLSVKKTRRPGQANGIANEMIAPQIPLDIPTQMFGLLPETRMKSLGERRLGRPPARTELQRRSRPPANSRGNCIGVPGQVPSTGLVEIATLDPVADQIAKKLGRHRGTWILRRGDLREFPGPMVIMQRDCPEPAVIAWPQQPVWRPTQHPFFIQVLKEAPRQSADDCLGLGGQSFVDDPGEVPRPQSRDRIAQAAQSGSRGRPAAVTNAAAQRVAPTPIDLRETQVGDGPSQPWPVFQGHLLSGPTPRSHC